MVNWWGLGIGLAGGLTSAITNNVYTNRIAERKKELERERLKAELQGYQFQRARMNEKSEYLTDLYGDVEEDQRTIEDSQTDLDFSALIRDSSRQLATTGFSGQGQDLFLNEQEYRFGIDESLRDLQRITEDTRQDFELTQLDHSIEQTRQSETFAERLSKRKTDLIEEERQQSIASGYSNVFKNLGGFF